uniref:Chromosome 9 open reading frame 43 n=1 Tax=Myotis lucifugus TaxID=59463 RepID=G1PS61_MYOLU
SRGQESCKVDFYPKPLITMDLPDESQWDETTCNLAACQHPQCWATIRRIERGHPRILGSSYKTPLDVNDKLPVLTIVNLSDSCFQARRRPHGHLPGLTFTKPHSLLSQRSKFDSKFQGRPRKDLPDKDLIIYTNRSPKLPVLNLNETQIPHPQGVSNMVVVWIPKEPGASVSQDGKKKRKTSTVVSSSVVLSGKQDRETKLSTPGMLVPPPSPVRFFEQLSPEFLPFLNQFDTLPQDLLNDLLLDEGKRSPCLETKTQLATRKKNPLKKSRPESAISAQMFLSVHRLTLQRPSLKYPAHLKKLYYNLNIEGLRKQQQKQQQRKLKTPMKEPEAKKKSKKDPGSQSTSRKSLGTVGCDPRYGHRTLPGGESDNNQQLQMEKNGPILKQDSTERPQMGNAENDLDSFSSKQNPELSKTESTNKDFGPQMEEVPVAHEEPSKDLSSSISRASWNPELQVMRISQAAEYEAEENQLPGLQ